METTEAMKHDISHLKTELQKLRDEIQLKVHLAGKDLQDSFAEAKDHAARLQQEASQVTGAKRQELRLAMLKTKERMEKILTRIQQ